MRVAPQPSRGLDMAAERAAVRQATSSAHDAPLGAADAPFVRAAIGIPVAAENIRHLGAVVRRTRRV